MLCLFSRLVSGLHDCCEERADALRRHRPFVIIHAFTTPHTLNKPSLKPARRRLLGRRDLTWACPAGAS